MAIIGQDTYDLIPAEFLVTATVTDSVTGTVYVCPKCRRSNIKQDSPADNLGGYRVGDRRLYMPKALLPVQPQVGDKVAMSDDPRSWRVIAMEGLTEDHCWGVVLRCPALRLGLSYKILVWEGVEAINADGGILENLNLLGEYNAALTLTEIKRDTDVPGTDEMQPAWVWHVDAQIVVTRRTFIQHEDKMYRVLNVRKPWALGELAEYVSVLQQ